MQWVCLFVSSLPCLRIRSESVSTKIMYKAKKSIDIIKEHIVPLDMRGCICHLVKWQIHRFISKGTICYYVLVIFCLLMCCKACLSVADVSADTVKHHMCRHQGSWYASGENWLVDNCTHCFCHSGQTLCTLPECPTLDNCSRIVKPASACCPQCAGMSVSDASCAHFQYE